MAPTKKRKAVSVQKPALKGSPRTPKLQKSQGIKLLAKQKRLLAAHEEALKTAVRKGVVAGITGTAIHKGETVFEKCFGFADLESRTPFSHDTICRVYCSSKPFINFATMMLVERGQLVLDHPVHKFIPSFKRLLVQSAEAASPIPAKSQMTVRHLLLHCSGLGYGADFNLPPTNLQQRYVGVVDGIEKGRIHSLAQFADEIAKIPLFFEPGERHEYSFSTDILGRVLEVVVGKSLDRVLNDLIFAPLGMEDTSFYVRTEDAERLAGIYGNAETWGYLHLRKSGAVPIVSKPGLIRIDGSSPSESNWSQKKVKVFAGGGSIGHCRGGLVSTAKDTKKWVTMLLSQGLTPDGNRLLSRSGMLEMQRNQLVGKLKNGDKWCLLGDLLPDGGFQQGGAAGNYWLIDRKRNLALVVMMQQVDGDDWENWGIKSEHADLDKVLRAVVDMTKP